MPALLHTAMQAQGRAAAVFDAGVESQSVKLAIKRLTAYAVQRSRPKLSVGMIGKLKLLGASSKKKVRLVLRWAAAGSRMLAC